MSEELGMNVKLAMESQSFQKQIVGINQQMKLVQSEFTAASTKVNGFGSETDKLTEKASSLGKQLELQKQVVAKYAEQFDKSRQKLEDNIKVNEQLKTKLSSTTNAYDASIIATGKNSDESKKLKAEIDDLNKKFTLSQNNIVNNTKSMDGYSIKMNGAQTSANKLESEIAKTNDTIAKGGSAVKKAELTSMD